MIEQGVSLMVVGMAAIFAFLVMLVFIIKIVASLAPKLSCLLPDPVHNATKIPAVNNANMDAIVAAIAVAMKRKKSK